MIVIDKAKLKFLLAGRTLEVDVEREYRKGRSYALGTSHRRSVCRIEVVERIELERGSWRLRIRQVYEEKPLYLAASPGAIRADYTDNPARAAREVDGSPIEAVDVGGKWLAKVAKAASDRDDVIRREVAHRARIERRNPSVSRVNWSVAPPASDIQAAVRVGAVSASPDAEAA